MNQEPAPRGAGISNRKVREDVNYHGPEHVAPYWTDGQVTLYCGDFRDLLPAVLVEHGDPDLVLTDPCYGETSLAWDRWVDGWPSMVPGRSMWCFGSMRMFLDRRDEFAGWKLSQDVVWEKQNGSGFATDRFMRVHEHALHWYRGPWADLHRDTPRVPVPPGSRPVSVPRRGGNHVQHAGAIGDSSYRDDGKRQMRSVIRTPNLQGRAINETEKPAGLVENLLTYGCPPGGLVLDVFAGGCSTLVAARNSGRRAVGIELREEQCAKAVEWRLSQAVLPFGEAS